MPILDRVIQAFQEDVTAKKLNIQFNTNTSSLLYYADVTRFEQIVWNLISNAIKFTNTGGNLNISVIKDEQFCSLTIADTGKGIEKHYLPFIFEMFNQAERGTSRVHGGMGIGLALVKELVEGHEGEISVASDGLGKGAQFTIKFPLVSSVEILSSDKNDDGIDSLKELFKGKKTLIVDDDKLFLTVFGELLSSINVNFALANSGQEALKIIQSENFDLIISDIAMPEMDGYQLLDEIKKINSSVPVIALTGFSRSEDVNHTMSVGFKAHLGKPVELSELLRTVNASFAK